MSYKLPESDNFVITTGASESYKRDVYLVSNKNTGIVEFETPVLIEAWFSMNECDTHLMELEDKAPTLSVVSIDDTTH